MDIRSFFGGKPPVSSGSSQKDPKSSTQKDYSSQEFKEKKV